MSLRQFEVISWEKNAPLTQEEAEARLHQEGYESFCWYDVPGAAYPKHRHEYDECLWILKGEMDFTLLRDGKEELHHLKTGDRVYVPAQAGHIVKVPMSGTVTYLVGQRKTTKPGK
ncbi:MAG: cupin domain-containing protein [Bdellovibrionota bacterium]